MPRGERVYGADEVRDPPIFSPRHDEIEATTDATCHLCIALVNYQTSQYLSCDKTENIELYRRICFHKACDTCPSESHDRLCEICKHMRLEHIIRCGLYGYDREIARDGRERSKNCEVCSVFVPEAARIQEINHLKASEKVTICVKLRHGTLKGVDYDFTIILNVGENERTGVRFVGTADSRCGKRLVMLDRPDVEINWEPFSRWIEQNETSAPSPAISELSVPTRFRVIDIGKKCVIKASSSCRYAALSYVWGNVKTSLQASTSNIESLGVSGSLSDIENPLAAVISDAITACEHLKIDYLWVDQLCILQDITLEEKTPHLNAMGAIYNHACVTLVALAGADANYGLPGVGGRQRIPRWKGKLQGLYLLNEVDGHGAVLRQSKWATRGWTFQEAMLSQRMLLFSDMGLVFEPYYGVPQYEDWGNYADWGSANIPLKNYEEQVKQFTRRDFSKESDILQAFAGLLSATCEEGHYYGLPLDHFDDSLFWYTTDKSYQARTAPDHDDIFPSWAWSSITGPIDFLRSDMKSGLLAMWAIPSSSDGENNLKVIPNSVESQQRGSYQDEFMMTHAWRRGCFPEKIPAALDKDGLSWDEYLEAREGKWSSLGEICHFAQGIDRQNTSISDAETKFPAHLQRKCGPGCLLVYTQSLRVKIIRAQDDRYFKLQDNQGVIVAWLLESTYKWDLISNACSDETADLFDLIALFTHWHRDSDESDPHVNGGAYGEECRSGWPSVISTERPLEPEMLKVILMLVKTEHGISKRVGLARAWLPVWCDVKPQFNTFILS